MPTRLEEVGQIFSVTRERVRQIEAKAVRKLQHPSRQPDTRQLPRLSPPLPGRCDHRKPGQRMTGQDASRRFARNAVEMTLPGSGVDFARRTTRSANRHHGEIDSRPPFGNARRKICRFSDSLLARRASEGVGRWRAAKRGRGVDFARRTTRSTNRHHGEIDSRPPFGNARRKICRFSDSLLARRASEGVGRWRAAKRGRESISPAERPVRANRHHGEIDSRPPLAKHRWKICRFSDSLLARPACEGVGGWRRLAKPTPSLAAG